MTKILEYRSFESLQNKYKYQDNFSFFPPTLETGTCFSRHLLVNRFLITKKPKYLFWSIEADPNVIMDPFCVETVNWWRSLLVKSNKVIDSEILSQLLRNIGIALSRYRDLSNSFHYDSGFVHKYIKEDSYFSFEVHPPRRCFRLVENFEKIIRKIEQVKILGGDLKLELETKYSISDLNTGFSNYESIAAQVISKTHNMLPKNKNDKTDIFLTPFIAEEIYKDAKVFCFRLEYIVDTFQIVDYWSPEKKR
ncbi:hypothetical protein HN460_01005 [bacterium]|nr:hypothetical protein [bacterium]MBT3795478.1 hypothetical protein [bacterium]MBT4634585.1 hypothetical protein [bacterium]